MFRLTYEKEMNPGFIADPEKPHVLWSEGREAAKARKRSELMLAYKVAQGEVSEGRMEEDYLPYFDNLMALTLWTEGRTEQAVSTLRKTADVGGSDLKGLRRSASMNLAAIFVKTGDYAEAKTLIEGLSDDSPEAAYIGGSAHVGDGDFSEAAKIYKKAYDKFKNADFLFHQALAEKKGGKDDDAVKHLKKYIDLETPVASHISRRLLKEWR